METKFIITRGIYLFLLIGLLSPAAVKAESARGLVAAGNRAYAEGKFDAALALYERAREKAPDSAQILFNRGAALYKQGDYEAAMSAFEQATLVAEDPAFKARSHYNFGDSAFYAGAQVRDLDPRRALSLLKNSVTHFQEAKRLDPQLTDAARNIEVARQEILGLSERIQQQEELDKAKQQKNEEMAKVQQEQKTAADRLQENRAAEGRELAAKDLRQAAEAIKDPEKKAATIGDKSAEDEKQSPQGAAQQLGPPAATSGAEGKDDQTPATGSMAPTDNTAQEILERERENHQRRQHRAQGYPAVDKDW